LHLNLLGNSGDNDTRNSGRDNGSIESNSPTPPSWTQVHFKLLIFLDNFVYFSGHDFYHVIFLILKKKFFFLDTGTETGTGTGIGTDTGTGTGTGTGTVITGTGTGTVTVTVTSTGPFQIIDFSGQFCPF
jgi:hypothetical protein